MPAPMGAARVHPRRRRVRRQIRGFARRGLPRRGSLRLWIAGQVAVAAAGAFAATLLLNLILAITGLGVSVPQTWLLLTGALLVHWAVATVRDPLPVPRLELADEGLADRQPRPFPHADRWERRLSTTNEDPRWYTQVVRDRMTTLAAERLRRRHGVPLAREPAGARAILGDDLYRFLTEPLARVPDPAELGRLITRMEEI